MRTLIWAIVFALLAAAGYFSARQYAAGEPVAVEIPVDRCDPGQQACDVDLPDGGRVSLSITPRPIPLMQPLQVNVRVEGSKLLPMRLDITGLNMEMGLNRTVLVGPSDGSWQGETILPICSQRRMHWQAALLLGEGGQRVRLLLRFHTLRP